MGSGRRWWWRGVASGRRGPRPTVRRWLAGCATACTLGAQGCIATENAIGLGLREAKGVVTSPDDMTVVGGRFIFHSNIVETRALGGTNFAGESKVYRIVGIDRDHAWWASVDIEGFRHAVWSAQSLQVHEGVVPPGLLDPPESEGRYADGEPCYSVHINKSLLDLVTCDRKIAGTGTSNTVTLRAYRTWWAYPSMSVAVPVAVAFDVITFPVQLYVYTHWNDERTRW